MQNCGISLVPNMFEGGRGGHPLLLLPEEGFLVSASFILIVFLNFINLFFIFILAVLSFVVAGL